MTRPVPRTAPPSPCTAPSPRTAPSPPQRPVPPHRTVPPAAALHALQPVLSLRTGISDLTYDNARAAATTPM